MLAKFERGTRMNGNKKEAETKEETPRVKVKPAGEPAKQGSDFKDPDEIHEARGSDEKAKVGPKQ